MRDVRPIVDDGLGNSSYLVEVGQGLALVVVPARDPLPYLREAGQRGLRIAWVAETHLHADFVSGARELGRAGATVLAPRKAELAFPHRGLDDGGEVELGGLTLRALATPGHTPEHVSYLLLGGPAPTALFTGGALLAGAVARTDLIAPDQTEPLARALYRSIRERLLTLPDHTPVYPTHGAGSFCSAPPKVSASPPSAGNDKPTRCSPRRTRTPSCKPCSADRAPTRPTSCGCGRSTAAAQPCTARTPHRWPPSTPSRSTTS